MIKESGCGYSGEPRVGVLGGSFDPVHLAHLIIAEEVRLQLHLEKVLFIPAGQPYMKSNRVTTPAQHRLDMVRLAVASNPYFEASSVDVDRAGPSYTIDTLDVLRNTLPQGRELYFIIGWDSLATLPRWREPVRILEMCRLVAVPRPGVERPDLKELEVSLPGVSDRVIMLDRPVLSISSTGLRDRVGRGVSIRYLTPEPVERYISDNGLYRRG
ncbi:MAG: nicotinate-nucleotide adenylyltransferase [Dehalococcoidia bacterium]|nr:nicotinate-nucleotide adenylyltransferase [Dehalococcoidia bacterium]